MKNLHKTPFSDDEASSKTLWILMYCCRELFDVVVESTKVGSRKPERRIYEICLQQLDVKPEESVFLDDLGVNLKAAKQLGIRTIKVTQKNWNTHLCSVIML